LSVTLDDRNLGLHKRIMNVNYDPNHATVGAIVNYDVTHL